MDKQVEQIKKEIRQLMERVNAGDGYGSGWRDALLMVDAFIDTMPEETVSENLEKAALKHADLK